uniref:Ion transport domain-containing protein n=1 Tax=Zooxanthella nutricula TaxID=1333877 RepID=A0A7S2MMA8_9DINO
MHRVSFESPDSGNTGLVTEFGGSGNNRTSKTSSSSSSSMEANDGPRALHRAWGEPPPQHDNSGEVTFRLLDSWTIAKRRICLMQNSRRSRRRSTLAAVQTIAHAQSLRNGDDDEDGAPKTVNTYDRWCQRFVVHPSCTKRLVWEFIGVFFVLYDLVVLPLPFIEATQTDFVIAMGWLLRLFWTADIGISFLTGYLSQDAEGMTEMRPSKVALRYLKTRLLLDLVIVSCDWLEVWITNDSALSLTQALRVVRCFRLARLAKMRNITDYVLNNIRSEGKMIWGYVFLLVMGLLLLIHLMACIWSGLRSSAWGSTGDTEQALSEQDPEMTTTRRYVESFHYVLSLFVGEHISQPANLVQRTFVVSVLTLSFVVSASFVGSLTTAMTRLQMIASQRSQQFAALNRYLSDCGISTRLCMRVQRNARHALRERMRNIPESKVELLHLISDPLRSEIHYEVYSPTLLRHPFFFLYNKINPAGVRQICHTTVSLMSLSRGDVLFSEFEVPAVPKMYFVSTGRLTYTQGLEGNHRVLSKQWLSEAALWTTWAHRGLLQARAECRLLAIDATRFTNIMSTFPTLHPHAYGEKFVSSLREANPGSSSSIIGLTDIGVDCEKSRALAVDAFHEVDEDFEQPPEWKTNRRFSVDSIGSVPSSSRANPGDFEYYLSKFLPRAWFRRGSMTSAPISLVSMRSSVNDWGHGWRSSQ